MISTSSEKPRLRTLIVGAGRRVQNNFLPALRCLERDFEVVGLHSRTAERFLPVAERWSIPPVHQLSAVDLSGIDVVAISVPTAQNAAVLRQLVPHAGNLSIVVDTPVAWRPKQLAEIVPLLRQFKRVVVTEDYMNFPQFALLRRAVLDGLIGTLRGVTLYNVGYQYHGLALIRSFKGFPRARRTWQHKVGTFTNVVGYDFGNDYRAMVVGPYRRHTSGGITLEGSNGILTEFPGDAVVGEAGKTPVYTLTARRKNDLIDGFFIDGTERKYETDLPDIKKMAAMDFQDKSDLNLLRGCGLIEVFNSLGEDPNINQAYGFKNALYDSFISRAAAKGLLPIDPLAWFGADIMSVVTPASRFSPV